MDVNQRKIAVLCNYVLLPERVGGMDYFFWMFDEKCKKDGIEVDWFFPNISRHGGYEKLNIHESGNVIERFFLGFLKKGNPEYSHIITHFLEICTSFFYKLKQISSAKIIAVDHNPRPLNGFPLKKKIEKGIKGLLFSRYIDVFVGVSAFSKNALIKDFGPQLKNKTIVIFNGLDISRFRTKTDFSGYRRFMVASHLRKEKGIQDLIQAVKNLKDEIPTDFTIDIYGEGYYAAALQQMTAEYSLEQVFDFKGSVPDLYETYRDYDYLIHPSHGETFCYSVVESLICNLPVITTKQHGNVLGLVNDGENGFLYEVSAINQLKNILKNILTGKNRISVFSGNNKVTDLSLEKMTDNYFKLLS